MILELHVAEDVDYLKTWNLENLFLCKLSIEVSMVQLQFVNHT